MNSTIRAFFETKLKQWADSKSPKIPIAFENVTFTKPTAGTFVEAFLIPNKTLNKELSGQRKTLIGLFQVNCWAPKAKGMKEVESLAQEVISLFPLLPKTGNVSVEQTPSAGRSFYDDSGWVIIPVTIQYRAEVY